jgi:serine/threonine-protein kinase RsbW
VPSVSRHRGFLGRMGKTAKARNVKLEIASRLDMLDLVQTVLTHAATLVGFGDEACHYMSVAVRESVVNAIKHGNRLEEERRVVLEFAVHDGSLEVIVADEGTGFDPGCVADPLAPENLLKPAGRGIFFMRSFMDEVDYTFPPRGGTVVRMLKRVA